MKTFVLELRRQYGEDYWTSDEPDQSSAWLGVPLVCRELAHLAGFPKQDKTHLGDEVRVEVSSRKLKKGRLVELQSSGDWRVGRVTETAGNRVASFFARHGLPAKFWIRVTRVTA